MTKNDKMYIEELSAKIKTICQIDRTLYDKYNVKRGLRNHDHTGVLVGLTHIGNVIGYDEDGERFFPVEGRLYYRGYNLNDLVTGFQNENRHGFDEVSLLLLSGDLPDKDNLDRFSYLLSKQRELPEAFRKELLNHQTGINVMNMLSRAVLGLYALDDKAELRSEENIALQSINLLAKFPAIVAYTYSALRHIHQRRTLHIRHPNADLSTAENFLYMLKGDKYTQLEADILDLALVVHAEHGGGNNSTFTVRVTSSAGTDTYSAISSAIGSLKGPYHGGANLKVLEMIEYLKTAIPDWEDEDLIADQLMKILGREVYDGYGKIYGIGHAVYTLSDPRAVLLKAKARELAEEKGRMEEFRLYEAVEKLAPIIFAKFKGDRANKILCANVDFYSSFVYSCLNIPSELYTPIFAIGRLAGWCAHRLEEVNTTSKRIIRPAYRNVAPQRDYETIGER